MKNEDDTSRIYTIFMAQILFIPVIAAFVWALQI